MIVGHAAVISRLEKNLPSVAIFEGPYSVGKWTAAEHLLKHYDVKDIDTLRIRKLDTAAAKTVVEFASRAPAHYLKVIIINMGGAALAVQNRLLKTLEEAHESVCFILIAHYPVISTIASRATPYHFGLLSDSEVARVLEQRQIKPQDAKAMASRARGSVHGAYTSLEVGDTKPLVVLALRAIALKDPDALEQVAGRWTDLHTEYTRIWAREALSGRWRWFAPEDSDIEGRAVPLKILMALRPDIRPRLVVRASLMSVLKGA